MNDKTLEKLILPTEVKVCATCSYWDGQRHVDEDVRVVVVDHACEGECMAQEKTTPAVHDIRCECHCIWEDVSPDEVAAEGGAQV